MMCFGFTSIFSRPICHADEMLEYFTWEDLATSNVAGHGYYQAVEAITAAAPSPAEFPSWSVLGPNAGTSGKNATRLSQVTPPMTGTAHDSEVIWTY